MKIRTDFVTNSSSSSFSVLLTITDKDNNKYSFRQEPVYEDFGEVKFNGDLKKIAQIDDISELIKALLDSIIDKDLKEDYNEDYDEDYDEDFDDFDFPGEERNRGDYKELVITKITSVDDIKTIEIKRDFYGCGESSECIACDDEYLRELAQKVCKAADADAKECALDELMQYLNNPEGRIPEGEYFGIGFDDMRYRWGKTKMDAERVAKKICSTRFDDGSEGIEIKRIDMDSKEYEEYAEYSLY